MKPKRKKARTRFSRGKGGIKSTDIRLRDSEIAKISSRNVVISDKVRKREIANEIRSDNKRNKLLEKTEKLVNRIEKKVAVISKKKAITERKAEREARKAAKAAEVKRPVGRPRGSVKHNNPNSLNFITGDTRKKLAKYDVLIEQVHKMILHYNPNYNMRVNYKMSERYANIYTDYLVLQAKLEENLITKEQFQKQLKIKQDYINSLENEINTLEGNDNFANAIGNYTINELCGSIYWKYFNPYTGEPDPDGVIFHRLDLDAKVRVLDNIYSNWGVVGGRFTRDDFVRQMLEKCDELDGIRKKGA